MKTSNQLFKKLQPHVTNGMNHKILSLTLFVMLSLFLGIHKLNAQSYTNDNGIYTINKDSLLKLVTKYSSEQYTTGSNIPQTFTEKKAKVYYVPDDETILAFADMSSGGKSKSGIAIGLKGLYIYNSGGTAAGKDFVAYEALQAAELVRASKSELRIRQTYIDISGWPKTERLKIEELLREIKYVLLK